MAVKALLILAALLATAAAAKTKTAEKDDDGRILLSTHGEGNTDLMSVTLGLHNIVLGGLLIVGLISIVILLSRQSESKELPEPYSEPSGYGAAPSAEKRFAIHHYLENAAARYDN